ncbi:MAG: 30S ribosomal protein S16 [Bacteroidetes bacterium]|nr:30S ribosomal protein S16 [Bacteroidota bacterium]
MPAIIRLSRHGKKGQAFYHIVVADSRFARDARFIEKLGTYNPRTNPVSVSLKFDRTLEWVQKGAKPSDTMRSILSEQGVMYKAHLQKGVKKGVFTQEQADAKYAKWISEKEAKVNGSKSSNESSKREAFKKRIAVETAARETRNAKRKAKEAALVPTEIPSAEASDQSETPSAEPQA